MPNRNQLSGITLVAVAVLLGCSACSGGESRSDSNNGAGAAVAVLAQAPAAESGSPEGPGSSLCPSQAASFNPSSFPARPRIDNPWSPLTPGARITLEGHADRGGGRLPHQDVFIVTDLVKVIDGVPSVVAFERNLQDGKITRAALAFFAQDAAGNVWNLGQYPEEWQDEKFVSAPGVWLAGIGDGQAGVHTKARPMPGVGWYVQGKAPSIGFLDCGRVSMTDAQTCVPLGCFTDVMVTEETNPLDPTSGIQLHYSERGLGIIQIGARGGEEGETMQLIESRTVSAFELLAARTSALAMEKRAYETSAIYRQSEPVS